jgi:hypothetical protein
MAAAASAQDALQAKAAQRVAAARSKAKGKATEKEAEAARKRALVGALEPGQRKAMAWINQYMYEHPAQIYEIKGSLEAGTLGTARLQKKKKLEAERFDPAQYKVFKQIPKYFLGSALTELAGFTKDEVDCIDFACGHAIRLLCCFSVGILDSSPVPKNLDGHKGHIMQFLKVRHARLGDRGSLWRARGLVKEDFTLDWSKGVYQVEWDDKKRVVAAVKHIRGQTANVAEYTIQPESEFGGNHGDLLAFFKKGKQELALHQFFGEPLDAPFAKVALEADAREAANQCRVPRPPKGGKSAEMFTLASASRQQQRQKFARLPSKGLAAPLQMVLGAPGAVKAGETV